MSFLPFALLANLLNSIALTVDKFLLTKTIKDPLIYIFYFSLISTFAIFFIPFAKIPTLEVFILASFSTLIWSGGTYTMFKALQIGQVQRVIPVIGTLIPLFILMFSYKTVLINEIWGIFFLLIGLILLNLIFLKGKLSLKEVLFEILAAFGFALSYLLLREAFLKEDFLTVFLWSKPILIPVGILIFLIPKLRNRVFQFKKEGGLPKKALALFVFGQISAGVSELLLTYSISLANPAVVNSLQGTKYVFLLILAFILGKKYPGIFREKTTLFFNLAKILGIVFIVLGLLFLAQASQKEMQVDFGVTFSPKHAKELGLNPHDYFSKMLEDLKVKKIRLPIYWDEVETSPNTYNFDIMDYYLNQAQKNGADVILVLGNKVPRWPECFAPSWIGGLMRKDREAKILNLIQAEVDYYKKFPNIIAWQVENETLLPYGVCDKVNKDSLSLLTKEIQIVKKIDKRPIFITDSGELSLWLDSIYLSDWFGLSLYRQVWDKNLGYITYPLPPAFYPLKNQIIRTFLGKKGPTIVSELQAEPWLPEGKQAIDIPADTQAKIMPVSKMADYISFGKQTNFQQIYLWGVEWWYFMAENGHPEYLEYAKGLFK